MCVCVCTCECAFPCANRRWAEAAEPGKMAAMRFCVETLYLGHLGARRIFFVRFLSSSSSSSSFALSTHHPWPSPSFAFSPPPNTPLKRGKTSTFLVWKKKGWIKMFKHHFFGVKCDSLLCGDSKRLFSCVYLLWFLHIEGQNPHSTC